MGKKEKINEVKENISEILELPKDIMLDLPKITLLGSLELSIENHKGIIEYTNEKIRVKSKEGIIKILGKDLLIKTIIKEAIIISGKISSIEFEGRGA